MSWDHGRPRGKSRIPARPGARTTPKVEPLEGRILLSLFRPPPTAVGVHTTTGAAYVVSVSGPGAVTAGPIGHGQFAINLFGTTATSQVTVTQKVLRANFSGAHLQIGRINVRSGELGSFLALDAADLAGTMSPLRGPVNSLQFDGLGRGAKIDVVGSLGQLQVAQDATLGPMGHVLVTGGVTNPITIGGDTILSGGVIAAGGASSGISVGQDLILDTGGFIRLNGPVTVGGNLSSKGSPIELSGGAAGLNVGGDATVSEGGRVHFAGDLTSAITIGHNLTLDAGRIAIDRDATAATSVGGNFNARNGGFLSVGRDSTGGLAIHGDLILATGGSIAISRDSAALTVGGNFDTSAGGSVFVGGNLTLLAVTGVFRGQDQQAIDLNVGLTLGNLKVLGGESNNGAIQKADIDVAKNIEGLDVPHGIFYSFITAGVLIVGEKPTTGGSNIGPDGPDSIFDSEIRAGVQIRSIGIGGDVVSDRVTNPTNPLGRPTRIIAGEDRQGNFHIGGNIDNFQIFGTLIDAVLAAAVKPNGGNGTVTMTCTDAPGDDGFDTYDAPAGTIKIGQVGAFVTRFNFTAPPYTADPMIDPTIDDCVLPGAINPSFAPTTLPAIPPADPATVIPLPSKSTILGGVISHPHGDEADFAGVFAADTAGVITGPLPR